MLTHSLNYLQVSATELFIFFKILFIYFLERWEVKERGKHQCVVASCTPPTGDPASNPGMCPTGNRTGDPLICRLALNPLSCTSQDRTVHFLTYTVVICFHDTKKWYLSPGWSTSVDWAWAANQRVAGLIPSQGTWLGCRPGPPYGVHKRQPHIDISLPLSFSSPLSKNE